jgi:phage-related protein
MEIKNWIEFAGTTSKSFKVYISGSGTFNAPERDVTKISVPGRNGDIVLDNGRYKNVELTYPAFIAENFSVNMQSFRNYMMKFTGYQRLEDTYHTDEFRMARYKGEMEVKPVKSLVAGEFDITFDTKPQRFLKSGETAVLFTANGSITNPTAMTAKPLLRLTGTGTVTIGGVAITVTSTTGYIDVDCETQEAYCGSLNKNSCIVLENGVMPELPAGTSSVVLNGITSVSITPRWWIL